MDCIKSIRYTDGSFNTYSNVQFIPQFFSFYKIEISISEIEALIKNFIFYLTVVHQDNNELIRQYIEKQGGYILHLDATCESDSPKLMWTWSQRIP